MTKKIDFTIIIPAYNVEMLIEPCLRSVLPQLNNDFTFEILLIDDCSTDSTFDIAKRMQNFFPEIIRCYQTKNNAGPGEARNLGIENALGEWALFLDSDDNLAPDSLITLINYIRINTSKHYDIIGFNWLYDSQSDVKTTRGGRIDAMNLYKEKEELLKKSISLTMDGSVIYTLFRIELLDKHNIRFYSGFHEDVDFIFKTYYYAKNIAYLDYPVYIKNNREESIVNTISEAHIDGFFRAYNEIYNFIKEKNMLCELGEYYYIGIVGVIATRIRDIFFKNIPAIEANKLYNKLYEHWLKISLLLKEVPVPKLKTKYWMIVDYFFGLMEKTELAEQDRWLMLSDFMKGILKKSWSCYDLHYSVFLGPDEIRTCCKRFFDNGKMNGDVVLVNKDNIKQQSSLCNEILKAKKNLYHKINCGESSECDACPFLEFKEWGNIEKLNIENISFEYHSICNMRCKYCSEKYFGGEKAAYNVKELIQEFISDNCLENCKLIVWGGGEPVVDKSFNGLINLIDYYAPNAKQRFISNAITYSQKINDLLSHGNGHLTTSIDAGSEEKFLEIRGVAKLKQVFTNLKKYAENGSKNITIKYIVLEDNKNIEELCLFVDLIKQYNLAKCNFQISYDFKKEIIDSASAFSIILLYGLLMHENVRLVFIDEFIRQRLTMTDKLFKSIIQKLMKINLVDSLADRNKFDEIIIWGAGGQTKYLLQHSYFFKKVKVKYIVDNTVNKIGRKYLGYMVYDPEVLLKSDIPVLIAAVQGSPVIYDEYIKLGMNKSRLIKGLVI